MKKPIKRALIGLALAVGLVVFAAAFFGVRFFLATSAMTPVETSKLNDSVFCCKDKFVNVFVFKGTTGYVLVDAGFGEESLVAELNKLNIKPDMVTGLLLTHTDGDHIGAVGALKNAKIYMHKDEEQMINGTNGKFPLYHPKWSFGPYTLLNSNDTLIVDGVKVKILHLPGHTPGSCCYLINNEYLAVGDNASLKNNSLSHFVDFFNMDTPQQEVSMAKVPELYSAKHILTAHFGILNR